MGAPSLVANLVHGAGGCIVMPLMHSHVSSLTQTSARWSAPDGQQGVPERRNASKPEQAICLGAVDLTWAVDDLKYSAETTRSLESWGRCEASLPASLAIRR